MSLNRPKEKAKPRIVIKTSHIQHKKRTPRSQNKYQRTNKSVPRLAKVRDATNRVPRGLGAIIRETMRGNEPCSAELRKMVQTAPIQSLRTKNCQS
jgi:hypothetical protein